MTDTSIARVGRNQRVAAAGAAVLLHACLAALLLIGWTRHATSDPGRALQVFDVAPDPPSPPVEAAVRHPIASTRAEGAAAPPNLHATPTEIVAPPPRIRIATPAPVIVAPLPGSGADPSQGAADVRGPGSGSGGEGTGTGSGRFGDGKGGGGEETPPRWRRGTLRDSDYPDGLAQAGIGGTVSVRYVVATDGRVSECAVTQSSGSAELDAITCRLIRRRFRFDPSRDAQGRPVASTIVEEHSWMIERTAPEPR